MEIIEYTMQVAQSLIDMIATLIPSANGGTMNITRAGFDLACAIIGVMGIVHRASVWMQKERRQRKILRQHPRHAREL
ncbi:hypothetical protein JS531_02785 [Bifidobacterium sp. CP2]|uniref:hypothetical protein n=1 Tax=Bifidobacterium TaxID=1678 RepID=UPI001BDC87B9|nr:MULTISPECIES: hypothetical protein [Bifidobacterium]MBT1180916.1 hypothetical protein [Bifidobacterium sp. CP2]MBW3081746.1 hypothetical protein [Bifidobacterium saguinibicoloris]